VILLVVARVFELPVADIAIVPFYAAMSCLSQTLLLNLSYLYHSLGACIVPFNIVCSFEELGDLTPGGYGGPTSVRTDAAHLNVLLVQATRFQQAVLYQKKPWTQKS
jgi:hypothetical protein